MLTLDFGKFYTTAGAEVIQANKNWLYSRSLAVLQHPAAPHGRARHLKVNDMLSLQASLVNGWNDDPDVNAWKTFGLSATITRQPDGDDRRDHLLRQGSAAGGAGLDAGRHCASSSTSSLALTLSDKLG